MMIQNEDQQALAKLLANYTNLLAAWLFGSSQTGMVRPGSDIDIAVWFAHSPDLSELVALRADLQDTLQFDEIDLVVLNNASPITRFEAVSGQLLYGRDRSQVAGFVSLAAREYEDAIAFARRGLAYGRSA